MIFQNMSDVRISHEDTIFADYLTTHPTLHTPITPGDGLPVFQICLHGNNTFFIFLCYGTEATQNQHTRLDRNGLGCSRDVNT